MLPIMEELRKRVDADKNDKSVHDLFVLLVKNVVTTSRLSIDDDVAKGEGVILALEEGLVDADSKKEEVKVKTKVLESFDSLLGLNDNLIINNH
ncbi:hypothetical protein Tco_1141675 [Tanacetum coccineum]